MKVIVLDSESDGLWEDATKIHVLSWTDDGITYQSTNDYNKMREVLCAADTKFVAHNAIRHDLPLFNKILGTNLTYKSFIDTLALSWYLHFDRPKHGIESYGIDYGIPKPVVEDWNNLTYEQYQHRCEEDVKINWRLWKDLEAKMLKLYGSEEKAHLFIDYLGFKMDTAREQELVKVRLDLDLCQTSYDTLLQQKEEKTVELAKAMPKKPVYKELKEPANLYKKDGSLSVAGKKWLDTLVMLKLPHTTRGMVNVLDKIEDGNPNSSDQVKEWLLNLGWKPKTFKYVKDKTTGKERMIPQVRDEGELCESVTDLIDKDPAVGILEGLTVISHRLAIFKSFLECHKDGWLKAEIAGLTNTLRFKHSKPLVNLPSVDKPWGKEVRGCLLPPEGYVWAGSDMVSLEDTTKRHYMKPLDPKYVNEMSQEGFDPHLNLALFAGAVTQDQIDQYNEGKLNLKPLRKKFKAANYSCIYGVGKAKLARGLDIPVKEAEALIEAYWKRNWSIKRVSETQKVRIVGGTQMWLQNPVSGFWHNLRSDKDTFSTLNQSTGVFCFDTWLQFTRMLGLPVAFQFHDEQGVPVKKGEERMAKEVLKDAIGYVNKKLKLNVLLDVDVQFGDNYGKVH
jgi:hypothetical protein